MPLAVLVNEDSVSGAEIVTVLGTVGVVGGFAAKDILKGENALTRGLILLDPKVTSDQKGALREWMYNLSRELGNVPTDQIANALERIISTGFQSKPGEALVLERGQRAFVIMNRYPYNNGHLLVAPNRHGGEFCEMTPEEMAEVMALAQRWQRIICEVMKAEGFNMGLNLGKCAGAGVADHLHLHIVPRWSGDTNFMPVVADAHVVPQALLELYDKLLDKLQDKVQGKPRASGEGGGR